MPFDPATAKADSFDPSSVVEDAPAPPPKETFTVPSRPREFVSPEDRPARMVTQKKGVREVPIEGPVDRGIYEAGGQTTDFLSNAGASPEVAAAGGYLTNVASQAATTLIGGGGGKAIEPAAKVAGRFAMRNALAPGKTAVASGAADAATEALLKEGISVSKGGREAAQFKIDAIKNTLDDLTSKANGSVYIMDALKPARDKIKELSSAKGGLDYDDKISKIQAEVAKLLDNPDFRSRLRVPVAVANDMKRSIYRELEDAGYKFGTKGSSEKEAKRVIAGGMKEQVEKFVPEAKGLNREMGDMIEARKLIDARLGRQASGASISPFSLLMAMHNPTLAALHFAERNPQTSSALARTLYSGGLPTKAGIGIGAATGYNSGDSSLARALSSWNRNE